MKIDRYIIIRTELFKRQFEKIIPENLKRDINRRIENFSANPHKGKHLGSGLIEMKAGKFRIYYKVFNQQLIVLFVGVSDKKSQRIAIQLLKNTDFEEYIIKYKNTNGV